MKRLLPLARLLEYPGSDFETVLATAMDGEEAFAHTMRTLSPESREELFTATFDITPSCVPYAGIHLFGEENFKRGEFMAALNARYEQAGFSATDDLPDHVANLLRFAVECEEAERRELAEFCLLGPLETMRAGIHEENPYRLLLATVITTLHDALPGVEAAPSPLQQSHQAACATTSCSSCGPLSEPEPELIPSHG